jgi:hypothetical protein
VNRAINAWAIFHPAQGLLLHAIDANQCGAWAMLNLHHHPDEPMRSEGERIALGFRAVQVRIKFDEPEGKP